MQFDISRRRQECRYVFPTLGSTMHKDPQDKIHLQPLHFTAVCAELIHIQ